MEHNQASSCFHTYAKLSSHLCGLQQCFVEADLKDAVWIHLPRGYKSKPKAPTCLRLKKSLYGLTIAPKLWYQYLQKGLIEDNFQQSAHDECLFFKRNMFIFLFVDDCGIASPDMSEIDAFIDWSKGKGFDLTKECDFSAYLGIKFPRNPTTNMIEMTQPGLIKKVIEATGMELCIETRLPLHRLHLDQILKDLQSRKPGNVHLHLEYYFIYLPIQDQTLPLQSAKYLGSTPIPSSLTHQLSR